MLLPEKVTQILEKLPPISSEVFYEIGRLIADTESSMVWQDRAVEIMSTENPLLFADLSANRSFHKIKNEDWVSTVVNIYDAYRREVNRFGADLSFISEVDLEAYRLGEIRDRGGNKPTRTESLVEAFWIEIKHGSSAESGLGRLLWSILHNNGWNETYLAVILHQLTKLLILLDQCSECNLKQVVLGHEPPSPE